MQEEVSAENLERVKSYMESVSQLEFELRNQAVKVNILKTTISERPGGMDLIYKYQLTH